MVATRPLLALLSVLTFAAGASLWLQRDGAVPDPLALGALPGVLVALAASVVVLVYLTLLFVALSLREKR
jgi:uncharacterized membrane protein YidH (DUF202 family)